MATDIDYEELDLSLKRCGSNWDAAQAHGLLSGRLATAGTGAGFAWLQQVLEHTDPGNALRSECESLLSDLFSLTGKQLSERQSEFNPLLPDEASNPEQRAEALGRWCEGFLHGLVSEKHDEALRARMAEEPIADIIKDMLEITRATSSGMQEEEAEDAYTQLVEYLRVAAQLVYEELAEFRTPSGEQDAVH